MLTAPIVYFLLFFVLLGVPHFVVLGCGLGEPTGASSVDVGATLFVGCVGEHLVNHCPVADCEHLAWVLVEVPQARDFINDLLNEDSLVWAVLLRICMPVAQNVKNVAHLLRLSSVVVHPMLSSSIFCSDT